MMKTKHNRLKRNKTLKHKSYLHKLKKIYPQTQYDSHSGKHPIYNTTYGEMNYDGMNHLFSNLQDHHVDECKTFMDLGCGRGSICMYMASKPNIKQSIGVELVKERIDDAMQLKQNLGKNHYTSKIRFYNDDILDFMNHQPIDTHPYLVWISNLLFDIHVTNQIYKQLIDKLPNKSLICSSKPPLEYDNQRCQELKQFNVPMSWSNDSNVYSYQIIK
jgi:ribosomal protein L11 methylase PrmA